MTSIPKNRSRPAHTKPMVEIMLTTEAPVPSIKLVSRVETIILDLGIIKVGSDLTVTENKLPALLYRNVGDICNRPRNEGRIAVLSENVSVYVLLAYLVVLGKSCAKTSSIKNSTRTDYAALRKIGEFVEGVGKDIETIVGNGFCTGHAETTLEILRESQPIRELFTKLYA